jgi:hypothetical protein
MFKMATIWLLCFVVASGSAFAEQVGASLPLTAGKPAGVHRAQMGNVSPAIAIGIGIGVLGLGLYLAHGTYKLPGQATTTTGTSP